MDTCSRKWRQRHARLAIGQDLLLLLLQPLLLLCITGASHWREAVCVINCCGLRLRVLLLLLLLLNQG